MSSKCSLRSDNCFSNFISSSLCSRISLGVSEYKNIESTLHFLTGTMNAHSFTYFFLAQDQAFLFEGGADLQLEHTGAALSVDRDPPPFLLAGCVF